MIFTPLTQIVNKINAETQFAFNIFRFGTRKQIRFGTFAVDDEKKNVQNIPKKMMMMKKK